MKRRFVLAGLVILLGGCASERSTDRVTAQPSRYVALRGAGLSIAVPPGWHISRRLTALSEPSEMFTVASYPITRERRRGACGPTSAVGKIPRDGALAFVFEYRGRRRPAPERPDRFALPAVPAVSYECFGIGWILRFRDHDRNFQAMIATGPNARRNGAALLASLDTLRVDSARRER